MAETLLKVGPRDQGKRMSLEEFECAEGAEGYKYELSRGVVMVDVPDPKHEYQVDAVNGQLYPYRVSHPNVIRLISQGSGCKILLSADESERHPDIAIYKTDKPDVPDFWAHWVPEIVIEIVSRRSAHRDYDEKPAEYLRFGVREYWIFDAEKGDAGELLVLARARGAWNPRIVKPGEKYTTSLLPGFELDLAAVFAAAR